MFDRFRPQTEMDAMRLRLMRVPLVAVIASSTFFLSGAVQAMTIVQFDKMADDDQDAYVADLVVGAGKVLRESGQADKAAQVRNLFVVIKPGDQISDGMAEFEIILAKSRLADLKRRQKDPNARILEVEDAMVITLKRNGIEVPDSFFTVNANFRPKLPPKK
jgi:hypothetical protein